MRRLLAAALITSSTVVALLLCTPSPSWQAMNPANPGLPKVDNVFAGQPVAGIANNGLSAMCVSCHTYAAAAGRGTHFVAHYSTQDGANRTTTAGGKASAERTVPWTGSGAASKYGNLLSWGSDNTAAGELICESCHNMVRNVGGGNNLVETCSLADPRPSQPNTLGSASTTLCEGCHVSGSLPGHHAMTGDVLADGTTLSSADSFFTRQSVDNVDMGAAGSEIRYGGANKLSCISCHGDGHSGFSGTGARLLRRGFAGTATPTPPAPGSSVTGGDTTGIDRQYDRDPTGANRLIWNFTPMCDACHKAGD